jgi:peptide-methionine (S)-S-oxide reductase
VQVEFDPEVISYEKILELFWKAYDPTTLNRQGADVGPQYRLVILVRRRGAHGLLPRRGLPPGLL